MLDGPIGYIIGIIAANAFIYVAYIRFKDDEPQDATLESYPLVNRVEIIGKGREFVKHDIGGISISYQDDNRTLKVFLEE
jgi:hypothetical protein